MRALRDMALLTWLTFCVCRGAVFLFAASAIATDHAWNVARVIIS